MPILPNHLWDHISLSIRWQRVTTLMGETWAIGWQLILGPTHVERGSSADFHGVVAAVNAKLVERFEEVETEVRIEYDPRSEQREAPRA